MLVNQEGKLSRTMMLPIATSWIGTLWASSESTRTTVQYGLWGTGGLVLGYLLFDYLPPRIKARRDAGHGVQP